mgnify:FL=1|jgi:protoporphyrinogen IX oxidase
MSYLWLIALHIIGVICWFAGLFYIFRLYVYHVENKDSDKTNELLQTMERRLYYGITWPAMVFTTIMGGALLSMRPDLFNAGWFHVKAFFLIILFGYHFFAGYTRKQFLKKNFFLTSKQCRFINEVPTIVLLVAVIMAVVKPF